MGEHSVRRIRRALAIVSVAGWLATFLIKSGVNDAYFKTKPTVTEALGFSAWLILFVVPVAATALALPPRGADVLSQRVRRVVSVCAVVSLLAILPRFVTTRYSNLEEAMAVAMFFLLLVGPSVFVYAGPTVTSAIVWSVWLLPFGALMWTIGFDVDDEWRDHITHLSLGTVLALGVIVLPIVAITARRRGSLPEARLR